MSAEESSRYRLEKRLQNSMLRPRSALEAAEISPAPWDLSVFERRKQCLVITYRKSGKSVATAVWFALSDDRLRFKTGALSGKGEAPSPRPAPTHRSLHVPRPPTHRPMEGVAHFLDSDGATSAERSLRGRYGLGRRLYYLLLGPKEYVYVEVSRPRSSSSS